MFRLLPRNLDFFNLFEDDAQNAVRAAELLSELAASNPAENIELLGAIKEREHNGDRLTHETLDRLERTYLTPFDREDIHRLTTVLDDIVDHIQSVAVRLHIYKISETTGGFREHCAQLLVAAQAMAAAVAGLRKLQRGKSRATGIEEAIFQVHHAENAADDIHHSSVAELFECGFDPFQVIKWKEIYDITDLAVNSCEDVANIIHGILLKNG
jgi:predicted phosphate transport protein (TIGR00153 family)